MKFNKIASLFAIALAPLLAAGAQGCSSSDDSEAQADNVLQLTDYTVDFDRLNAQYPGEFPMTKLEDAWTALVRVGDQTIPSPTHLFGDVINVIPYSNEDGGVDAAGEPFARGDMEIAKYFTPGKVGIGLKMHRPEQRVVDLNDADPTAMKEDFKLQDTHIEIVVGVERAEHGHPGAVTLNNPQTYEQGRFGDATYSMIFLTPQYPEYIDVELEQQYESNIRTALVGFNAITDFPGDYNGGDPLGANNPERMLEYVDQMVRAIAGDAEAKAWFQQDENLIYCAELAFISMSGGLIAPLSNAFMAPRVGDETWQAFVAQVDLHNAGVDALAAGEEIAEPSNFVQFNDNKRVAMVRIELADDELAPVWQHAPDPEFAQTQLALTPMTMADIVKEFMRTHLPREILGESLAPVQAAVLTKMKPGLLEAMAMDQIPEEDPRRQAVDALFGAIIEVVGTSYGSYDEFQEALAPLMAQAQMMTGPRPGSKPGEGLFTPPSLFHVAAQGTYGGLLKMQYLGHGVHAQNVVKNAETDTEPTPVEEIDATVSCATAGNAPEGAQGNINGCGRQAAGGCWCDSLCSQYGDCCSDYAPVCGG
jgi:Somatomedin B domain